MTLLSIPEGIYELPRSIKPSGEAFFYAWQHTLSLLIYHVTNYYLK